MPTSTSSTPQSRQAIEEGLLEHDHKQLKAEGDECSTDQGPDIDWTDQVMDPILKTPSKSLSSSKRKHKSPVTTPSSSKSSSAPSTKVPRLLLPSPGKRYLQQQAHAQQSEEANHQEVDTVEDLVEKIVFGEISQGPPKVCSQ